MWCEACVAPQYSFTWHASGGNFYVFTFSTTRFVSVFKILSIYLNLAINFNHLSKGITPPQKQCADPQYINCQLNTFPCQNCTFTYLIPHQYVVNPTTYLIFWVCTMTWLSNIGIYGIVCVCVCVCVCVYTNTMFNDLFCLAKECFGIEWSILYNTDYFGLLRFLTSHFGLQWQVN